MKVIDWKLLSVVLQKNAEAEMTCNEANEKDLVSAGEERILSVLSNNQVGETHIEAPIFC